MAAKTRVNITFDPETLRLADREARRSRISRSAWIRAMVRESASNHQRNLDAQSRANRQLAAIEGMRALARKAGSWPAVEILHAWRDRMEGKKK